MLMLSVFTTNNTCRWPEIISREPSSGDLITVYLFHENTFLHFKSYQVVLVQIQIILS